MLKLAGSLAAEVPMRFIPYSAVEDKRAAATEGIVAMALKRI
jgi:hypothetical protein